MRVLVAHDVGAARTGGMSRLMGFTHDRLRRLGWDVDYVHADADRTRSSFLRRFSFPLAVRRQINAAAAGGRPYDVVNIHEPSAVPAVMTREHGSHLKIVVTSHGVEQRAWELALEERRLGRDGPGIKSRIAYPLSSLWQSRIGLRHADHVFCLNEEDREYLIDRFGLSAEYITRIVPGADAVYSHAAAGRDYRHVRRLLFAATWRKNKGIEDLVPAFTALVAQYPWFELIVLGAGVSADTVRAAFAEPARSAVHCVTARTDDEAASIYASADLFVLPSLFEGTPLTLLEAMASGLPIVTTAVCGMKDLIRSGENGVLVPIRSPREIVHAVQDVVERIDLRQQVGTAAREDALHRYTWDRAAERVASAYEQIVDRGRVKAAKAS